MKKNKDIILIKHILDAIADIEEFTSNKDFSDFQNDKLLQNGVVREFMIIGEASANLSDSFREQHSKIPFYKIIGMRNVMVHAYWQIDERVVWDAYQNDLPELKKELLKI